MLGSTFYHQTIRKYVAVFGTLFNDINIERKNSSASGSNKSPFKKSKTANRLALSKSFTAALCTNFMCSETEADNIFEQTWNESHGEPKNDNNNNKDDSSKE